MNNQLLFQEQVPCDDRAATTWLDQLGQGAEQVKKQVKDFFHAY